MANLFSGVISTVKLTNNSPLNSLAKGLLSNTGNAAINFGLSKVLGGQLSSALGIAPTGSSNFLPTIVGPGLISTGIQGLSQVISNSVINSKALGPFGPLAGNLLNAGVNALGNRFTNSLFGGGVTGTEGSSPSLYFPGAGGPGEGTAEYPIVSSGLLQGLPKKSAYALGSGVDVVFAIVPAGDAAKYESELNTVSQPTATSPPSQGPTTPGETPGSSNAGQPAATTPAAQAAAPTPAPTQVVPGSGNQGVNPSPPTKTGQTRAEFLASGVPVNKPGVSPASRTFPALSESAPGTPEATQAAASREAETQPTGANTGNPIPGSSTSGQQTQQPAQPLAAKESPALAWKFICPPEDISWETTFQADRVPIFGMNDAPVVGGTRSMRDLTLNNAIVEGFTRGKTVEDKIKLLEDLTRMKMVNGAGQTNSTYMQIPVYKVYAGGKAYGSGGGQGARGVYEDGYFIIKSVKVQEKMRDLKGRTTRALVDISLTQVPSYQVESGRDQASAFLASQRSIADTVGKQVLANTPEIIKGINAAAARSDVNSQASQTGPSGGASSGSNTPSAAPAPRAPTRGEGSTQGPAGR